MVRRGREGQTFECRGLDDQSTLAAERLERVGQQVREDLPQLVTVALHRWQVLGHVDAHRDVAAGDEAVGHVQRVLDERGDLHVLDLQPHRPDEVQHLHHDRVGHLGLADDVGQHRLGLRVVGEPTLEQPGHHLDPGQRVLDLVGDGGCHLAQGSQAIAQPLAFLELLDPGQVPEEERRAGDQPERRRGRATG